jgi:hypothetical protein
VCIQLFFKSGVSYIVESNFSIVIQRDMACMIWNNTPQDMVDQSFGFFEVTMEGLA